MYVEVRGLLWVSFLKHQPSMSLTSRERAKQARLADWPESPWMPQPLLPWLWDYKHRPLCLAFPWVLGSNTGLHVCLASRLLMKPSFLPWNIFQSVNTYRNMSHEALKQILVLLVHSSSWCRKLQWSKMLASRWEASMDIMVNCIHMAYSGPTLVFSGNLSRKSPKVMLLAVASQSISALGLKASCSTVSQAKHCLTSGGSVFSSVNTDSIIKLVCLIGLINNIIFKRG